MRTNFFLQNLKNILNWKQKYNTYIFGTICRLKGGGTNRVTLRNEQKQGKVLETSELNLQLCKNSFYSQKEFFSYPYWKPDTECDIEK